MLLEIEILNSDATLNDFRKLGTHQAVRGADTVIKMRLIQPSKGGIRYIPDAGATFSIDFIKSDSTTITKTPTQPFSDDRSILQITLTEAETVDLISQNLNVQITEGSDISYAILQAGFQMVTLNSDC